MENGASSYLRDLDGDQSRFTEIVEQYGANLIFFINRYVNNIDIAEDLMEDTFCDLFYYKNRFKGNASFKTYLFAIARNKAVDYLKKSKRNAPVSLDDIAEQSHAFCELEHMVIHNERKKQLNTALNKINSDYKMVLHLLYFEELSYEEAGKVLKKSNKQIKNLAYNARQALKQVMMKEGFVYEEFE